MKKPTRRNASKALRAYFTFGDWSRKMGVVEGKRLRVYIKVEVNDERQRC